MRRSVNRIAGIVTTLLLVPTIAQSQGPLSQRGRPEPRRPDAVAGAIRDRLRAFENAWNSGDLAASIAQDDPSLVGILDSAFLDYAGFMSAVRSLLAKADRGRLRIELNMVRPLGEDYALANGRVYTIAKDGDEHGAPFTVVYMQRHGKWRLIYSHS